MQTAGASMMPALPLSAGQHGVRELWSAERDFGRFPGLTVINPLFARLGDVAADRLPDQGFTYNLIFSYLADLAPNPRVAVLGTGGLRER